MIGRAIGTVLVLVAICGDSSGSFELESEPPTGSESGVLSAEELAGKADAIVHGTLQSIEVDQLLTDGYDEWNYRGVFQVDRVESGEGISVGDRLPVLYWRRSVRDGASPHVFPGYWPLPRVGESAWLFANRTRDFGGELTPLIPNGWVPDDAASADPSSLYGGELVLTIDNRSASVLPFSFGLFAAGGLTLLLSVRLQPISRPPAVMLAGGLFLAGSVLLLW